MKKFIKHIFLLLLVFKSTAFAVNNNSTWSNMLNALDRNNNLARKYLDSNILKYYDQQYHSYKIYSFCQGSFSHLNSREYLMSAINENGSSLYLLALGKPKADKIFKFSTSQMTKFIFSNQEATFSNDPTIQCKSSNYMKLVYEVTKGMAGFHWYNTAPSNFDSFCISNPNSDHDKYGYKCYTYNQKNKKFILRLASETEDIP